MCFYAAQYLKTGYMPKPFAGDDINHEGGDFIISKSGKVEYVYVSKGRDRPPISDVLDCLKKLHNS